RHGIRVRHQRRMTVGIGHVVTRQAHARRWSLPGDVAAGAADARLADAAERARRAGGGRGRVALGAVADVLRQEDRAQVDNGVAEADDLQLAGADEVVAFGIALTQPRKVDVVNHLREIDGLIWRRIGRDRAETIRAGFEALALGLARAGDPHRAHG